MNLVVCTMSNMIARILASAIVVAILMVQSAHLAHATISAVNASDELSAVTVQPASAEHEAMHVNALMQINNEKPGGQSHSMAGDCMTLSCCFVVDDRTHSVSPLFVFGLSMYLNLNFLASKAKPVVVHERPPRTV